MKTVLVFILIFLELSFCYSQTKAELIESADTKWKNQDYKGAMAGYNKAIELFPESEEAYSQRGNLKSHLEDYRGAISDYSEAIILAPDKAIHFYSRALAKENIKDYSGAVVDYSNGIDLNPEFPFAYSSRANIKIQLQDYRGAIADFTHEIDHGFGGWKDYYFRGMAKLMIDQKESGCLDLSKAGELGYSKAYDTIKEFCN